MEHMMTFYIPGALHEINLAGRKKIIYIPSTTLVADKNKRGNLLPSPETFAPAHLCGFQATQMSKNAAVTHSWLGVLLLL